MGLVRNNLLARSRRSRAAAPLEIAFALPVLVALAMGICEYGYFLYAKTVFQEAAQAGARIAIQSTATDSAVTSEINSALTAAGFSSVGYTVTTTPPSVTTIATGTTVTVSVTCPWSGFGVHPLPTSMGGIPSTKLVSGSVTMTRE